MVSRPVMYFRVSLLLSVLAAVGRLNLEPEYGLAVPVSRPATLGRRRRSWQPTILMFRGYFIRKRERRKRPRH